MLTWQLSHYAGMKLASPVQHRPVLTAAPASEVRRAFVRVCRNRQHFPPDADIWHLRFYRHTQLPQILSRVNQGRWVLSPMTLVRRADGTRCAVWSAADAVVINALTLSITPLLPVSGRCEHIAGHGGGKQSLHRAQDIIRREGFTFVCRTDIRDYYANIRHDLLSQFLHYTVEEGGNFHSPRQGIPRASALSPLLAAFHLTETDRHFEQQPHLRYARFMDDFLIFARTRHHLRKAVKALNRFLASYGFVKHPEKTFIGRIEKGTDWMGFRLDDKGCGKPAPRAVNNMLQKLRRLYEQARHLTASQRQARVAQYLKRWLRWARLIHKIMHSDTEHIGCQVTTSMRIG